MFEITKKIYRMLALLFFLYSCVSNDSSVLDSLSSNEKSEILTKKGIALYKEKIEKDNDYSPETKAEVKNYFAMAISYNKDNQTAQDYITRIDSLAKLGFKKMYDIALTYKDVRKKGEADEFYMCFYLEKALALDAANPKGLQLKNEIRITYDKLLKLYVNRGNTIKNKINTSRLQSEKDKLVIAGYDNYSKAALLDGTHSVYGTELSSFENKIAEMVKTAITTLDIKIKKKQFDAAAHALYSLDQNNNRIHKKFAREILELKFQLYHDWAVDLYGKNSLKLALYKIDAALSIKNDNYLTGLKNKISDSINSDSIDSTLADIDALISSGDLFAAKGKIDYYKNTVKDAAQKKELEKRSKLILAKIPDLYQAAVDQYNAENIKEAIKMFDAIKKLNPNYLDTNSYLEKAITIQNILDNS